MVERISQLFHQEHQRLYGHSDRAATVHWITLRASVIGDVPRPAPSRLAEPTTSLKDRREGVQRMIWQAAEHDAPLYLRASLGAGDCFRGPALVVQADASLAVPPDTVLTVQPTGDILLSLEAT
jgi:N-methylhydantoinase A